jgi:cytochrome c2
MTNFTMKRTSLRQEFLAPFLVFALCVAPGAQAATSAGAAAYQQECAACHIAYPPGMLPAASWKRLMGGLHQHFGADASLDAATTAEIGNSLQQNAASYKRVSEEPPHDRITQSRWFVRQHNEVSAAVWKRASVGSASRCDACHAGAAKGHFNEDDVHIPK